MSLLILGGTNDARKIAQRLHDRSLPVIYSIAGLVRRPELPCRVVSGGFSQFGGLTAFFRQNDVTAVVDATHPYARKMTDTAITAARNRQIPVWRYLRPPWCPQTGDDWYEFGTWNELMSRLKNRHVIFFTTGQLPEDFVKQLEAATVQNTRRYVLRTAVKPKHDLPGSVVRIEGIGPFSIEQERQVFSKFNVDCLVSKNSGGTATAAKLSVARERQIPVFMLRRPALPAADREFTDLDSCIEFVGNELRGAA